MILQKAPPPEKPAGLFNSGCFFRLTAGNRRRLFFAGWRNIVLAV
jgi:hypothetical protein